MFLGPEMKSTGEVMGINDSVGVAFLKAMQSMVILFLIKEQHSFLLIKQIEEKH